ncbi:hypothetical protein BD408DRAFT_422324 [Parasitella parasitica]|nr:hypothetical protein BD408DRAFT_422324 [Parasitella parasitica]
MFFSYISRLFKQLSKSRWIQVYFALVIVQTLLSIPVLIKTLVNTEDVMQNTNHTQDDLSLPDDRNAIFGNYLTAKGYKIIYENVLFIAFEIWRLWTLTDGIVHLNSLTILASAWFSVFSSVFNVLLVIESNKWITSKFEVLKVENKNLQIALSTTLFLLSVPVIISAYKTAKIIGWQVYKKIGSSIELQNMYQNVQWFALWLKIDIYFEIVLLIFTTVVSKRLGFQIICIIMTILVSVSLIFARFAITRESNWMMFAFLFLQVMLLVCNIYSLVGLFEYSAVDLWFTGIVYEFASSICIIITVYMAIRCQINFGKGLKPFVFWIPFQGTAKFIEEPPHYAIEAGLLGVKGSNDRMPIDDEDDDFYNESTLTETRKALVLDDKSTQILRKSMEQVDNLKMEKYYASNMIPDAIKLKSDASTQPARMAMKPVPKNATVTTVTTTINRSKPWRSEISPVPDNNSETLSTIVLDPGTSEPTIMRRVVHPILSPTTPNSSTTTTITKATSTTTITATSIYP